MQSFTVLLTKFYEILRTKVLLSLVLKLVKNFPENYMLSKCLGPEILKLLSGSRQKVVADPWARLLLQPLRWHCVDCVIHHERDVRDENHYINVVRTRDNRVIMTCELYCCLLQQCEALRVSRSSFSDCNTTNTENAGVSAVFPNLTTLDAWNMNKWRLRHKLPR